MAVRVGVCGHLVVKWHRSVFWLSEVLVSLGLCVVVAALFAGVSRTCCVFLLWPVDGCVCVHMACAGQ
jgi:hypothetical protein